MRHTRLFLVLAALFPLIACEETSPPTSPAVPVDSIAGFVPLAVGNAWKYDYRHDWGNGHNGDSYIDSGSRQITIAFRTDSAMIKVFRARIDDSISERLVWNGIPQDTQVTITTREIRILEDSSRISLFPGTEDKDGMLAACFRGHAFPADSVHKVPGNTYATPGLPDTIFAATLAEVSGLSIMIGTVQVQAVGLLDYAVEDLSSFHENGSTTSNGRFEYRLGGFQVAH